MNGMEQAVKNVGTQLALARLTGRYPQEISRWLKAGKPPKKHCRLIERASGVPVWQLRPESFAKESDS